VKTPPGRNGFGTWKLWNRCSRGRAAGTGYPAAHNHCAETREVIGKVAGKNFALGFSELGGIGKDERLTRLGGPFG
jgi:hypothetical protein